MGWRSSSETVRKIGKMPKIEIIPSVKIEASSNHRLNNHLLLPSKSFLCRIIYSNHSSIHGMLQNIPHRFNYQSKMLNEPYGNCLLNEPLIDYGIPKYFIFIIKIYQDTIFPTYPELHSAGKVVTLAHGHVIRIPLPHDVARLVSLPERAELKK